MVHEIFRLNWYVDTWGYELVWRERDHSDPRHWSAFDEGHVIVPKGGPIKEYRPSETHPGLFRRFSELGRAKEDILSFVEEFGLLGFAQFPIPDPVAEEKLVHWRGSVEAINVVVSRVEGGDTESAVEAFNAYSSHPITPGIRLDDQGRAEWSLRPISLLGLIWIQTGQQLLVSRRFRQCRQCPTWFLYGPGTGHTTRKKFCSDRCKTAWHRENRKDTKP